MFSGAEVVGAALKRRVDAEETIVAGVVGSFE